MCSYSTQNFDNKDSVIVGVDKLKNALIVEELYQNCLEVSVIKDSIISNNNKEIKILKSQKSRLEKDCSVLIDNNLRSTNDLINCKNNCISLENDKIKLKKKNKVLSILTQSLGLTAGSFILLYIIK